MNDLEPTRRVEHQQDSDGLENLNKNQIPKEHTWGFCWKY